MNLSRLAIVIFLIVSMAAVGRAQTPPISAAQLIHEVVFNELADRAPQRKWIYRIDKREGNQTLTEEQVDTIDGPFYRVLAINGAPLDAAQLQQDNLRMDRLLHDRSQQLKLKQAHEEDEKKLETLMRVMQDAFLYDYDGVDGNFVRIKFHPDPNYNPPTYEARVAHSLGGTALIDLEQKRLVKVSGQLLSRVDFGYGLLGHIDQGGNIEIGRTRVAPSQWKTALINIQLSGRLVFFKTISKQEYETRSDFRAIGDLSPAEASQLLRGLPAAPIPVVARSYDRAQFLSQPSQTFVPLQVLINGFAAHL